MFAQKGTGRARRGSARSPILRGGGKAFGPRNNANFVKNMPKKMRRAALKSCLSMQASNGVIIGLEGYPNEVKTKGVIALLEKLPVSVGRTILFVLPERHEDLQLSIRNVPGAKTVNVAYLNPVDVLCADSIIFMVDSIKMTEEIFGVKEVKKKAPAKKTDTKAAPKKEEEKKEESQNPYDPYGNANNPYFAYPPDYYYDDEDDDEDDEDWEDEDDDEEDE